MKRIRDLFFISAFVLLLQVFMQRDMYSGHIPDMPMSTINGHENAALMHSKPVIIYFWGSWCAICTAIQETISEVLLDYPGVTVALRSGNNAEVLNYLHKHQLSWPVINDKDGALAERFGVSAVPAVFIVGPDREVSFVIRGYVTEIGLRIRLWWLATDF